MQLLAVSCLSLAAKMEEIEMPLLVDLQVENHVLSLDFFFSFVCVISLIFLLILEMVGWRTKVCI